MYSEISSIDTRLRPYQQESKDFIFKTWDSVCNIMLQMPTGTGKTVLFSSIIRDVQNWMALTGQIMKVLIIVHRIELIEQTKIKLGQQYHVASGVIAGTYERDLRPQVQIASIQTLTHPANSYLLERMNVGFIIIDEAHHSLASSYQKLWEFFPNAKKLGVTATPWRMNHAGFTELYDKLIQSWSIKKFIENDYLAKFLYYSIKPTSEEQRLIDNIKKFDIEGDFEIRAMESAMDTSRIRANLLDSYNKYAKGKRGIIYAITRSHAKRICSDYKNAGVNIDYIDSTTKPEDRKNKVENFRSGKIEVLVNVDIFSEGFDCPALDFVQLARPTKSLVKYLQQVGRALRPNGDKKAIILDNVGMFKRFGLPDANRKWAYHFEGSEVEESCFENETDPEYTTNIRRLNDVSEGSEDMVLLNSKSLEQTDGEKEIIVDENCSVVQQMEDKLNYLGIPHGIIVLDKGLFFDLVEKEDIYIYKQVSIKYLYSQRELLSFPKESILGRLCKEFGPHFSQKCRVDGTGDFYFENGISYNLGNISFKITDALDLCYQYDEEHKAPIVGSFQQDEYDISKYNADLCKILEIKNDPTVKNRIKQLINTGSLKPTDNIFYNGKFAYLMLLNGKSLSIKKLIIDKDVIKSIQVARASRDSFLYKSCKKHGVDAIRYIQHYGGKFTTIMFMAEDNSGIYITAFDGNTIGCYYDFEVKCRYLYAKEIGSESSLDSITEIPLNTTEKKEVTKQPLIKNTTPIKISKIRLDQTYESNVAKDFWFYFSKDCETHGSIYIIQKDNGNVITLKDHQPISEILAIDATNFDPIITPEIVKRNLIKKGLLIQPISEKKISPKFKGYDLAHKFQMKQKNGEMATGCYNPDNNCFSVAKGCHFPVVVSDSFSRNNARDSLIRCSKKSGDFYITTKEYEFDSPSTAACIIKGYSTNGFVEWKTVEGFTLKEIYKNK